MLDDFAVEADDLFSRIHHMTSKDLYTLEAMLNKMQENLKEEIGSRNVDVGRRSLRLIDKRGHGVNPLDRNI